MKAEEFTTRNPFCVPLLAAPVLCCLAVSAFFLNVAERQVQADEMKKSGLFQRVKEARLEAEALDKAIAGKGRQLANLTSAAEKQEQEKANTQETQEIVAADLRKRQALEEKLAGLIRRKAELEEETSVADSLRSKVSQLTLSRSELEPRIAEAKTEAERLEKALGGLKKQREQNKKTFDVRALYGGPMRQRAAVFVECGGNGVIIQPQGKQLSRSAEPTEQRTLLSLARKTGYVVFLVRPDGLESFRRYRQVVVSQNNATEAAIDLGYEPVDSDWVLTYGKEGSSNVGIE